MDETVQLLAVAASSSRVSLNRALLEAVLPLLEARGARIDLVDYALFATLEHYDFDAECHRGLPAQARELVRRVQASDGLVVASPEYNHSVPGTLKNGIDWLSRVRPSPLKGRFALLMAASPSLSGGWRGLQALRTPLEALGCHCHPDMVAVAGVRTPAEIVARLAEPEVAARTREAVQGFAATLAAIRAARPRAARGGNEEEGSMQITGQAAELTARMLKKRLYVVHASAQPNAEARQELLAEHLRYMIGLEKHGALFASGPLLAADDSPSGDGLTVLRAASLAQAEAIAAEDPFVRSGFRSVEVRPWQVMEGRIGIRLDFSDGSYALE